MWDTKNRFLYAIELKTVKGKSISFERTKEDSGEIHYHQIEGLKEWNRFDNTKCGLVIEFRQIEKTVYIDIDEFQRILDSVPKKSFSYDDLDKYEIKYLVIDQKKARTRFTYDIDGFLSMKH